MGSDGGGQLHGPQGLDGFDAAAAAEFAGLPTNFGNRSMNPENFSFNLFVYVYWGF